MVKINSGDVEKVNFITIYFFILNKIYRYPLHFETNSFFILSHEGIDLLAPAGTSVYSPIDGTVTHIGWAYGSEANQPDGLRTIHVTGPNGHRYKLLYVAPVDALAAGAEVSVGDQIGTVVKIAFKFCIISKVLISS